MKSSELIFAKAEVKSVYAAALTGERVPRELWVRAVQNTFGGDPCKPVAWTALTATENTAFQSGNTVPIGSQLPLDVISAFELARRGNRATARERLADAIDQASSVGATDLAAHLQAHLKMLDVSRMDQLTTMEEQTAQLAARGLTNKQIARELFISLRTVETHLTHIYRKLTAGVMRW